MSLIKSISGIRGTIGGAPGDGLTPIDIVKFTSAFVTFIRRTARRDRCRIVVGRDARVSGPMVRDIVVGTATGMGCDVIDLGLATTPTTEIAVTGEHADGGIIITASHNPIEWNALKLLNSRGEFLSAGDGEEVLRIAGAGDFDYADAMSLGRYTVDDSYNDKHVELVAGLPLVDADAIRAAGFRVAIDCVNSVGGIILPRLLRRLGVDTVGELYCEPTGVFGHTPEPLEKNLGGIMDFMAKGGYDLAFVVDPDVDRLVMICEDGKMFGEEYTLVSIADYVLSNTSGNVCSNLSSTRALRDVAERHGSHYYASAVGEVNVVARMKECGAVIGGEGNGGVIYPAAHYGRDALVGIALFLTMLAKRRITMTQLKDTYPQYYMVKDKIALTPADDLDAILDKVKRHYAGETLTDIDGVKVDFADRWVHVRRSNTEPIIRIYAEARTTADAGQIVEEVKAVIRG